MKLSRRNVLHFAAVAAALPALSRVAMAQSYPARPGRVIVPVPAGGQIDIIARLIGHWLSERLGQPFVVENRPGAATNLGTEAVVRAPADGYTLLATSAANAVNATFFEKLNFDFLRDTTAVAGINRIPLVLETVPSSPIKAVPELIAYGRANPGKLDIATPTTATAPYMAAELLRMVSGIDFVHVPFRGESQMLTDLLGGQVQVALGGISTSIGHIRAGKLRAIAVTTAERLEPLPDVPTVGESLPGFEASGWCGIVAPRNTPVAIVEKLNREINAGLADPSIKARLAELGVSIFAGSPGQFAKHLADETEKWGKVVKFAGIKPE